MRIASPGEEFRSAAAGARVSAWLVPVAWLLLIVALVFGVGQLRAEA